MRNAIVLVLSLFLVSGCVGPQEKAGITQVMAEFYEDGKPKKIEWTDGKEKADMAVVADLVAGKVSYSSKDVRAFEGQALRAEVHKELISAGARVIPEIAARVTQALMGGASIESATKLGEGLFKLRMMEAAGAPTTETKPAAQ